MRDPEIVPFQDPTEAPVTKRRRGGATGTRR